MQTGKQVVVLVDEYDKPLLQALDNLPLFEEYRKMLKAFYGVLKSADRYLRFVFLTGVTKFSQVSVFSDFNQLNDISMKPPYATICGITKQELIDTFTPELDKLASYNRMTPEDTIHKMTSLHDGYRFSPVGERLFNSTILTYFFKKFAANAGSIPSELIDENLRTDINWIRRLTLSQNNAKEMLDALVIGGELSYNVRDLSGKFNKKKFFEKEFYPVSLFYLGMTTLKSAYRMVLPNMTMLSIYMDYYNQLNKIEGNASRYVPVYELYDSNRSFEPLVQNYFEQYLGQFPAQVFDKINENFIRCSFYELVSRYLSHCYTFAIEQNNSVGRSDFEMIGIPGTDYYTDDRVVEFKYYRSKDADRMLALTEPLVEHVEQVKGYAADTKRKFPNYHVRSYIVYICANKGWKCWEV